MKKILSIVVGIFASAVIVNAASTSITVNPGTFTNLLTLLNGSAQVQQIVVAATTATNVSVVLVDTPTNILSWTNAPYTNYTKYASNVVTTWTNFYGVAQSYTNLALVTVTNSVAGTTNYYPTRFAGSALAGGSSAYNGVNYYFSDGIWVTNISSGQANITITYQQ